MKRLTFAALLAVFIHGTLLVVEFPEPKNHLPTLSEFKTLNFSLLEEKSPGRKKEKKSAPKPKREVKKEPKKEKPVPPKPLPSPKPKKMVAEPVIKKKLKKRVEIRKTVVKKPVAPSPPVPVETITAETAEMPKPPVPTTTPPAVTDMVAKDDKSGTPPASHVIQEARPLYLENPPPHYPLIARKRKYEGAVLLDVFVDMGGRVADVRLFKTSGYAVLDKAALKSVTGWKFEPARRGKTAVSMWVRVPIRFRLED